MKKKLLTVSITIYSVFAFSQLQDIKGEIIANNSVEGIHVLNKTALKYTVTDTDGSFRIPVKLNDTLTVSGLAYKTKNIIITSLILSKSKIKIYLEEEITKLEDVFVGRMLTGSLGSDLKNTETKAQINFYDLGIPGYTGKPKTLNERKLHEATTGGGLLPLNPILNLITGRTKQLKTRIKLDQKIKCANHLKDTYKVMIFENRNISEIKQNRFFDFIVDSEGLQKTCKSDNGLTKIEFLNKELKLFIERQNENDKKE